MRPVLFKAHLTLCAKNDLLSRNTIGVYNNENNNTIIEGQIELDGSKQLDKYLIMMGKSMVSAASSFDVCSATSDEGYL